MKTLQFILTVSLALLVGTMFGIWVGFNPAGLSAVAYVEQQQNMIRSFNILLPAMGAICILLTLMLAFLYEKDFRCRYLLFVSAAFLIAAGLITGLANQPINAIVITWSAQAPPPNWMHLRDVLTTLAVVTRSNTAISEANGSSGM